jgi:biotin synthase
MITNKKAVEDTIAIAKSLKQGIKLPISILTSPTIVTDSTLKRFKDAGAEMVGIAIDTATQELFAEHRGKGVNGPHKWEKYWEVLQKAVSIFGRNKPGAHLIVGLGETERQMVETIQRVRYLGAKNHLFSFYSERGSLFEEKPSCDAGQYQRVQFGTISD